MYVLKNQRFGVLNLYKTTSPIAKINDISSHELTCLKNDISKVVLTAITSAGDLDILNTITPSGYKLDSLKLTDEYFGIIHDRRLQVGNFILFRDSVIIQNNPGERIATFECDGLILIIVHAWHRSNTKSYEISIRDEVRTVYGKNKHYVVLTAYDRLIYTRSGIITSVLYNNE